MGLTLIQCEIGGETGLDIGVVNRKATVADLMSAIQEASDAPGLLKPYHRQRYARCAGCITNCCKHNSITMDLVAVEKLAAGLGLSVQQFAAKYLNLNNDLPYPELKQRPCPFLSDNQCTQYSARALICRLYLCTPMTDHLEQLRASVSFAGEAALKQLLAELGLAPARWSLHWERQQLRHRYLRGEISQQTWKEQQEQLELLWLHNPFHGRHGYEEVKLKDCCTERFWHQIAE